MVSFEERIRPPFTTKPWRRELLGAGLIIALTLTLLSPWRMGEQEHSADVIFSFYLLPGLGMCLALRCGAVDLSVWGVSAMGGALGAWGIRLGASPATVLLLGLIAGALLGAIHAGVIARFRIPSFLVTLVTASLIFLCFQRLGQTQEARTISVPVEMLSTWREWIMLEPVILRKGTLLVGGTYLMTMVVLIGLNWITLRNRGWVTSRVSLSASLCASGALAGLGGALWLLDRGSTPIPSHLFGDLRVPAAAVLAGSALFSGRGRTALAVLCLPAAMLIATIWRQEVVHLPLRGYSLQMLLLIGMTICAHVAIMRSESLRGRGIVLGALSIALTISGMLLLACSAATQAGPTERLLHSGGIGVWALGSVLLLVSRFRSRTPATAITGPDSAERECASTICPPRGDADTHQ